MTLRLFDDDAYLERCEAEVLSCERCDGGYKTVLDKTVFYPRGGGQPCEGGNIASARVLDVYEENGDIIHLTDTGVSGGVLVSIDTSARLAHMQQHSGQHLLSAVIERLFNEPTIISRLEEDCPHLELAHALSFEQLIEAEDEANRLITEGMDIICRYYEPQTAAQMPVRGKITAHERIRLVEIKGYDLNACGGTHLRNTREIGSVIITGTKEVRGVFRVYFKCGEMAREERTVRALGVLRLQRIFGCEDIAALTDKAGECLEKKTAYETANRELRAELLRLKGELLLSCAERIGDRLYCARVINGEDVKQLKAICDELTQAHNCVLLLAAPDGENTGVLFAKSKEKGGVNLGAFLSKLVSENGGKGGGSPILAQGFMPWNKDGERDFYAVCDEIKKQL